jgi:hypothetical protein
MISDHTALRCAVVGLGIAAIGADSAREVWQAHKERIATQP